MAEGKSIKSKSASVSVNQKERYETPRVTVTLRKTRPGRDTEGGLTEAQRKTVLAEEERIKDNDFETAVIVNKDGDVVGRATGSGSLVSGADIVRAAGGIQGLKDAVLIHNHPGNGQREAFGNTLAVRVGSPLSPQDIFYASFANVAEMRATTPNYIYSVRRPAGGWPNLSTSEAIRNATERAGRRRAYQLYDFVNSQGDTLGKQRGSRAELLSQWETIQAMAKAMGTTVTRRRR